MASEPDIPANGDFSVGVGLVLNKDAFPGSVVGTLDVAEPGHHRIATDGDVLAAINDGIGSDAAPRPDFQDSVVSSYKPARGVELHTIANDNAALFPVTDIDPAHDRDVRTNLNVLRTALDF